MAITKQMTQIDTKMSKIMFVNMIKHVMMCKAAQGALSAFRINFLLFGKIIVPFFTTAFYCFMGCITFWHSVQPFTPKFTKKIQNFHI